MDLGGGERCNHPPHVAAGTSYNPARVIEWSYHHVGPQPIAATRTITGGGGSTGTSRHWFVFDERGLIHEAVDEAGATSFRASYSAFGMREVESSFSTGSPVRDLLADIDKMGRRWGTLDFRLERRSYRQAAKLAVAIKNAYHAIQRCAKGTCGKSATYRRRWLMALRSGIWECADWGYSKFGFRIGDEGALHNDEDDKHGWAFADEVVNYVAVSVGALDGFDAHIPSMRPLSYPSFGRRK